jgi:hypothetical protein
VYKTIRTREQLLKAAADFAPTTACKEIMLQGNVSIYKPWINEAGMKGWLLIVHGKNRNWRVGFAVDEVSIQPHVSWPNGIYPTRGLTIVYGDRV